ncbi:hypothetical protein F5Y16DRAFT_390417 [Xylariaceae sp. FL0255]|nr:hypothetical protein F5Y16DRAFT_390417 [Xylariaceae sp. FL0255]
MAVCGLQVRVFFVCLFLRFVSAGLFVLSTRKDENLTCYLPAICVAAIRRAVIHVATYGTGNHGFWGLRAARVDRRGREAIVSPSWRNSEHQDVHLGC